MSIAADLIRGHTETIILSQLIKHDSYGYEINKTIRTLSGGRYELKEATLYTAFRRLEEMGYISAYWGGEATGARRRYYRITEAGRKAHGEQIAAWNEAEAIIRRLLDTEGKDYA
ncbi:MAG: helix-turn-helix transcriptional regulator [Clostridia bacterium]|nr:helix-turn-helix transcriptional regulator [Clostridia bacterium]MBQ9189495.1 helix-turn-helix transcriptional regulator [Clostridia bacterium]